VAGTVVHHTRTVWRDLLHSSFFLHVRLLCAQPPQAPIVFSKAVLSYPKLSATTGPSRHTLYSRQGSFSLPTSCTESSESKITTSPNSKSACPQKHHGTATTKTRPTSTSAACLPTSPKVTSSQYSPNMASRSGLSSRGTGRQASRAASAGSSTRISGVAILRWTIWEARASWGGS